jgi:phosphatidylserine/phosphatidylglycerophosphate/cardiolipin synthase-like enzyme
MSALQTDIVRAPSEDADALHRQTAAHEPISDCPLTDGNTVSLLTSAAAALAAMFATIAAARDHIHMEYYTFEDVEIDGQALSALLADKLRQGVRIAIVYDAVGSSSAPDALFDGLAAAGARLVEYRPLNPLRRRFSFRLNDRDHRKILVVDGKVAFLGGVNMARVYQNPPSAGAPADGDTAHAFWRDAAVRIEGPAVAHVQNLFLHTWQRQGGGQIDFATPRRPPRTAARQSASRAALRASGASYTTSRCAPRSSPPGSVSFSAPAISFRRTGCGNSWPTPRNAESTCGCCCLGTATCRRRCMRHAGCMVG